MKKKLISAMALAVSAAFMFAGGEVAAYQIETLPNTEIANDIVLGPGKIEATLDPGESTTRTIYFTNRTGRKVDFTVNVEDFKGSRDVNETTIFMGEQKGPYSLKDSLHPDAWQFTLEHGQRISLPVKIEIPSDAEPGGLYGVVFATAQPPELKTEDSQSAAPVVGIASRVGTLFFVRVKGQAKEDGALKNFSTLNGQSYFENGPVNLQFTYENNGSVHLVPYGTIEIANMMGKKIDQIQISPYFAMPDSDRLSEIKWDRSMLFGRYTATLSLNRGYQDIIDSKTISFWIVPWKFLLAGLAALVAIIWFLGWVISHFELKKKS
jgi:hypothetical protein